MTLPKASVGMYKPTCLAPSVLDLLCAVNLHHYVQQLLARPCPGSIAESVAEPAAKLRDTHHPEQAYIRGLARNLPPPSAGKLNVFD